MNEAFPNLSVLSLFPRMSVAEAGYQYDPVWRWDVHFPVFVVDFVMIKEQEELDLLLHNSEPAAEVEDCFQWDSMISSSFSVSSCFDMLFQDNQPSGIEDVLLAVPKDLWSTKMQRRINCPREVFLSEVMIICVFCVEVLKNHRFIYFSVAFLLGTFVRVSRGGWVQSWCLILITLIPMLISADS